MQSHNSQLTSLEKHHPSPGSAFAFRRLQAVCILKEEVAHVIRFMACAFGGEYNPKGTATQPGTLVATAPYGVLSSCCATRVPRAKDTLKLGDHASWGNTGR